MRQGLGGGERGGGVDLEQPADELHDLVAQRRRGRELELAADDVDERVRLDALEIGAGQGLLRAGVFYRGCGGGGRCVGGEGVAGLGCGVGGDLRVI